MTKGQEVAFRVAKVLVGLAFIVFGMNFFLKFMPVPPPPTEHAKTFLGVLVASGFLAVVKVLEILGGLLLISGRLAPLGLLILGPITVCILLYHVFMDPGNLPMTAVLGALQLFIAWCHKEEFAPFFRVRADRCTIHPEA